MMKRLINTKLQVLAIALLTLTAIYFALPTKAAQGWPQNYGGVMLQGFYWDSFNDSQWATLEQQASDLASTFSLVWIPQSGNCGSQSMGYDDLYWFNNYNSSFGNEKQLRSMISTFREYGLGTIADVVVNHRRNVSNWFDFPRETYKGVTYEMTAADICGNDDNGATATEAKRQGVTLGSADTGEGWDGMRDLDHTSRNVQTIVKAYLDFLKNDLGYAGFRYDMVKGYSAAYTGQYNASADPEFSVGEYWDGNPQAVKTWISGTVVDGQIRSAAFDFPFRYTVRDAINSSNWTRLSNASVMSDAAYRRYAVTFVENHDTEYRSAGAPQDPLRRDTLAANAFLIAMPGTPCVFMKHWQAYRQDIKAMVEARRLAGITNTSTYTNFRSSAQYFANNVDGKLLVVVGDEKQLSPSSAQWTRVLSGYHYAYYLSNTLQTAWADKGSGDFTNPFDVRLTAVTAADGAQLVYTIDGSQPSAANGQRVASGATVRIAATTTLKVGLLVGGTVSGIVSRSYTYREPYKEPETEIPSFCHVSDGEVCAFFEAPAAWGNTIYCWAWTVTPADNFTYANRNWPGVACEEIGTADNGNKVWKWTWDGTKQNNSSATMPAKIIFNNNGQPQTADLGFVNGGYYTKDGLKATVTAIRGVAASQQTGAAVYDLQGRKVTAPRSGLYIRDGRKFIVR